MEFLRSFPGRHFVYKPVKALQNVGCFQRLDHPTFQQIEKPYVNAANIRF